MTVVLTIVPSSAFELLRHRNVPVEALIPVLPELASVHPHILSRVETDAVYSMHLRRQEADLRLFMEDESLVLDPHLDYSAVEGLSSEVRERLARVRPTSIVSGAFSTRVCACVAN